MGLALYQPRTAGGRREGYGYVHCTNIITCFLLISSDYGVLGPLKLPDVPDWEDLDLPDLDDP